MASKSFQNLFALLPVSSIQLAFASFWGFLLILPGASNAQLNLNFERKAAFEHVYLFKHDSILDILNTDSKGHLTIPAMLAQEGLQAQLFGISRYSLPFSVDVKASSVQQVETFERPFSMPPKKNTIWQPYQALGFGRFFPKYYFSAESLPQAIWQSVQQQMQERIGEEWFSQLHFSFAGHVDLERMAAMKGNWPANRAFPQPWMIVFAWSDPSLGIQLHEFVLSLDESGRIVGGIPLPNVAQHKAMMPSIPLDKAWEMAEQENLPQTGRGARLVYDSNSDALVWQLHAVETSRGSTETNHELQILTYPDPKIHHKEEVRPIKM